MIHANWKIDFVGTVKDTNAYQAYKGFEFDPNHEGHSGWTSKQINSKINDWLEHYTPDIVLYHIGTNDMWKLEIAQSLTEITETINKLRTVNPNIKIYLGQIIPIYKENKASKVQLFNSKLDSLTKQLSTPASPILIVDHYSGFTEAYLTEDNVHPNKIGAIKMAENWAKAMGL